MSHATLTTVASNILTYTQNRLLTGFHNQMIASQFCDTLEGIPAGEGNVGCWHRKVKPARTSAVTAEGSDITPRAMYMSKLEATAAKWADGVSRTMEVKLTSKHLRDWELMTDDCSTQAVETLDYQILKGMATKSYRLRADSDALYQVDSVTTSDGAAGGTTLVDSARTEANDYWNGGFATITGYDTAYLSRNSYCETQQVTDFVSSGGTITTDAFPSIIKSGVTYHIVVGTGIVATDVISHDVLSLGVRQLKRNLGLRFNDALLTKGALPHKETANVVVAPGEKYWAILVDQDIEYDFMKDAKWEALAQYQDKEAMLNGSVKKWMGCLFAGTTQSYRETVAGVESTTGAVHIVNILGAEAYAISPVANAGSKPPFGLNLRLSTSEDLGEYTEVSSAAAWWAYFAHRSKNSKWNIGLVCGATA